MAPTADRPPVELLLCGHHFRASAQKLRATGARVFDAEGHFLAWD